MKTFKSVLTTVFAAVVLMSCGGEKKKEKESFSYEKESATNKSELEEAPAVEVLTDKEVAPLLAKNTCVACHKKDEKLIGPSYKDIAKRNYEDKRIVELIYKPEPENWPEYKVPMLALPQVPKGDAFQIARWINSLK